VNLVLLLDACEGDHISSFHTARVWAKTAKPSQVPSTETVRSAIPSTKSRHATTGGDQSENSSADDDESKTMMTMTID
jgi:hypothetical protein